MASLAPVGVAVPAARRGTRPAGTTPWVVPPTRGHSTLRDFAKRQPPPPPLRRAVVPLAYSRGEGRSASTSRGRSRGRAGGSGVRGGRGGRGGGDGGRRGRDDAGPGRVGWGERIARDEHGPEEDDPRGSARGEEGAWRHAGPRRSRAWAQSTASLDEDEDFRVVDVRARGGDVVTSRGDFGKGFGRGDRRRTLTKNADASSASGASFAETGVRVNKCFKDFTSRRESDKLVDQGRVTVNGAVVSAGARVFPGDVVRLDGDEVDWETKNRDDASLDAFRYVKYWKPRGITCTTDHRDRTNILDAVRYPERVFPVGRLDKDSTGLILLTSDGRLPNAALRAGARKEKKYVVCLDRPAREADLRTLREGVVISTPVRRDKVDRIVTARTLPCDVAFVKERNGKENFAAVRVTLREGRNRQIRRMFDAVGYVVRDLHRTEIMGIGLEGLTCGEWKECSPEEMELIRACLEDADAAQFDAAEEEEDED